MRYVAIAALAAGCASAGNPANSGTSDADPHATIDGKVFEDAPGHPIDAPGHHDAPPDSPPDAFVFLDAPPCVPHATQLLANPTFDLNANGTGWTQIPIPNANGGPYPPITGDPAELIQSAPYHVWLGGLTGADVTPTAMSVTDQVYQDVTVPAGTTSLVLTGYYLVGTTETTTTAQNDHGTLDLIQTNGTPLESVLALSNLNGSTTDTWLPFNKTFTTNFSGAATTVRLRMTSTNNGMLQSNFFFDTFALTATHCP